jgi:hypothetical protein
MSGKLKKKLGEAFGYIAPQTLTYSHYEVWTVDPDLLAAYPDDGGDPSIYGSEHPVSYYRYPYNMEALISTAFLESDASDLTGYSSSLMNFQKGIRIVQGTEDIKTGLNATAAEGAFDNAREVRNGTYTVSEYVNKLVEEQQEVSNELATVIASYIDTVVTKTIREYIRRQVDFLETADEGLEFQIENIEEDIEELEEEIDDLT